MLGKINKKKQEKIPYFCSTRIKTPSPLPSSNKNLLKKSKSLINYLTISMITAVGVLVINLNPIWTEPLTKASSSEKEPQKSHKNITI